MLHAIASPLQFREILKELFYILESILSDK